MEDLLQVAVPVAARLPVEAIASGYDNQATALVTSDLLVERLETVAGELAALATETVHVPAPTARTSVASLDLPFGAPWEVPASPEPFWLVWGSVPGVHVAFDAPAEGTYVVSATLFGVQRFTVLAPRVTLVVDGTPLPALALTSTPTNPETATWTVRLTAGSHEVGLGLAEAEVTPPDLTAEDVVHEGSWSAFGIRDLGITGPLDPAEGQPSELRARLLACEAPDASLEARRTCATSVLRSLAGRAWRRPVTNPEVERLSRFVDVAEGDGRGWDAGLRDAFSAVLLSPWFLYRVEGMGSGRTSDGLRALTPHELATRLSFLAWGAPPDDALRACADEGTLGTPEGACSLRTQLDRLLDDGRATALAHAFGRQWIGLSSEASTGDEATNALLEGVLLHEDAPLAALLRPTLAGLPDDGRPGGVLALPEVLAATSVGARSSVAKRGVLVAARLVCDPPAAPPADVPALEQTVAANPLAQVEAHLADPVCGSCHAGFDPYGLVLEAYGPDGASRSAWPDGTPLPDAVDLPDGTTVSGVDGLVDALLAGEAFSTCVTEQLATWAWGAPRSATVVRQIAEAARRSGGSSRDLLHALVDHPTFGFVAVDPEPTP